MSQFAVVQQSFETIDPDTLRDVLIRVGGMLRPDAVRAAKQGQGVLWERFEWSEAEAVAALLGELGHDVCIVPTEELPILPKPRVVHQLGVDDRGLAIPTGSRNAPSIAPWSSVLVISSGVVREIVDPELAMPPSMIPVDGLFTRRRSKNTRESKRVHVTDVIARSDRGRYLYIRLPAKGLAYERILDPALALPRFQKYLAVLDILVKQCPTAIVSPPTERLLAERTESFDDPKSAAWALIDELNFLRYNRWLLQLLLFRLRKSVEQRKELGVAVGKIAKR